MSENLSTSTFPCPICEYPVPVGSIRCPNVNCQEDLSSLIPLDTTAEALYQKALRLSKERKNDQAIDELHKASSLEPERVDIWVVLGKLYAQSGDYAAASHCWNKAIAIQPEETRAKAGLQRLEKIRKQGIFVNRMLYLVSGLLVLMSIWLGYRLFSPAHLSINEIFNTNPVLSEYDVEIVQTQNIIMLVGELPSNTERNLIIAAIQAALPEATVDASELALIPPTATATPTLTPTPTATTEPPTLSPTIPPATDTPTPTFTPTMTPVPTPLTCQVTTGVSDGWLNLRVSGSISALVIDVVKEGTILTLRGNESEDGWLPVVSENGTEGWVFGSYCK